MTAGRWHLYGSVIEGGGYSMQVMFGNDDAEPFEVPPTHHVQETLGGGPPVELPWLGSWMRRPTIAEKNAVLPPGIEPETQADNEDEYGNIADDYDADQFDYDADEDVAW